MRHRECGTRGATGNGVERASLILGTTLSFSVLLFVGCESAQPPDVVPVTGKVLLDGAPLEYGSVTFQPLRGQPARGKIQSDGTFSLSTYAPGDGAKVGKHQVRVTCYESQEPGQATADGPAEALGNSLIAEKYTRFATSGLEVSVLAGGNKPFVFELETEEVEPAEDESAEQPSKEQEPGANAEAAEDASTTESSDDQKSGEEETSYSNGADENSSEEPKQDATNGES